MKTSSKQYTNNRLRLMSLTISSLNCIFTYIEDNKYYEYQYQHAKFLDQTGIIYNTYVHHFEPFAFSTTKINTKFHNTYTNTMKTITLAYFTALLFNNLR